MAYVLNTPADRKAMLARIGVSSVEELFANIPPALRLKRPLAIPPVWFPEHPTLSHFGEVMRNKGFTALKNSLIVSSSATLLALGVGSLAAYAL